MRVRALDVNGDRSFGNGQADFLVNSRAAVAQNVQTRFSLWQGDWFLSLSAGMTWRTDVLGRRTEATRDPAIRNYILGTTGVTGLPAYASQLDRVTRKMSVQALVDTPYGQTPVSTGVPAVLNGDVRTSR